MKKLLALLLALVMVFSMAACSNTSDVEDTDETQKEVDSKEVVEETVESFMDAYVNLEFDKLEDYVVDKDEIPEEIRELDLAATFEETMSTMPEELASYSDEFEGLFNDIIDIMKEKFAYEIKDVDEADEDTYNVTVEVTIPNIEDVDFETIMSDSMNNIDMNVMVTEMVESGKITETSTEQEIMDLIVAEVIKIMKETIADIDFETTTEEIELVVVKSDDEWLIDAEESDLN